MLRAVCACAVISAVVVTAAGKPRSAVPANPDDRAIAHVLNRLGFGPAPGDIERVRGIGLAAYIEQQLHPERIADEANGGTARRPADDRQERAPARAGVLHARADGADRAAEAGGAGPSDDHAAAGRCAADRRPARRTRRCWWTCPTRRSFAPLTASASSRKCWSISGSTTSTCSPARVPTRIYLSEYEREAIRPHVFGKFRDLLQARRREPGDAVLPR